MDAKVKNAMGRIDRSLAEWRICQTPWQTIRAHLMSQDTEISRLCNALVEREGSESSALIKFGVAECRLAAADALLREISITAGQGLDMSFQLRQIQSHLQGSGDEA